MRQDIMLDLETLGNGNRAAVASIGAVAFDPRGAGIAYWDRDTSTDSLVVANAPTEVTYALASPQRQILAFGCNEEVSNDFNPLCIRGSDIENITDWTTTATNNAFEHILDATAGRIVTARFIGPYVAIWTDVSLYIGEFLGQPDPAGGEHRGELPERVQVVVGVEELAGLLLVQPAEQGGQPDVLEAAYRALMDASIGGLS